MFIMRTSQCKKIKLMLGLMSCYCSVIAGSLLRQKNIFQIHDNVFCFLHRRISFRCMIMSFVFHINVLGHMYPSTLVLRPRLQYHGMHMVLIPSKVVLFIWCRMFRYCVGSIETGLACPFCHIVESGLKKQLS